MKKQNKPLSRENIEAIANWLKENNSAIVEAKSEEKSEVEKIIDNMAIVSPEMITEPYTL